MDVPDIVKSSTARIENFDEQTIDREIVRSHSFYLTHCIGETPKRVFLHTVKTQMKCSMMLHFIRVDTVCKGKKHLQTKKDNFY